MKSKGFVKADGSGLGLMGIIFMVIVVGFLLVALAGDTTSVSRPTGPSRDVYQQCPGSFSC